MYDLEKEIKRKISIRNDTREDMNKNKIGLPFEDELTGEQLISKKIDEMESLYIMTVDGPIYSHRKTLGPVIICMKKIVRKLMKIFMGWYFTPIFERQTDFNERMLSAIKILKDLQEDSINQNLDKYRKINDRVKSIENSLREIRMQRERTDKDIKYMLKKSNVYCDINLLSSEIDYFDFENAFRGSREEIIRRQTQYIEYFRCNEGSPVLDIGCGRGEFLEIMKKEGIKAYGIDIYAPFVNYCRDMGFEVESGDALTYLSKMEDNHFGGVFMDAVIEHLEDDYVVSLIKTVYSKLKWGAYFIIVGPNPESLGTWQNFNIDMQHKKPVHYLTLDYLLKRANFSEVKRYENPYTDFDKKVSQIEGIEFENKEKFNIGMKNINELVFGNREYAIIAKK